jgi:hypothetical protein
MLIGAIIRVILGFLRKNQDGSSGPTRSRRNRE